MKTDAPVRPAERDTRYIFPFDFTTMPQIFCIIDEGGRTLVTKASSDVGLPSFPTVGLLCSISTFSDNAGYSVQTFGTTNVQIIYKRLVNPCKQAP